MREALNHGISFFDPNNLFNMFVNNPKLVKELYGKKLIKLLTNYDINYINKNIKIPEFQEELKKRIEKKINELKKEQIINDEYQITEIGYDLAIINLYLVSLDSNTIKSFSHKMKKVKSFFGIVDEIVNYTNQRFKDIAIKESIKRAIKRSHEELHLNDLYAYNKKEKGELEIILCLDSSSSMKGEKIDHCKKAAITLAYLSIKNHDKIGLIVFSDEIKERVKPTKDLKLISRKIIKIKPIRQTDLSLGIIESLKLFSRKKNSKHLIILTDALPTKGENPKLKTIEAVKIARNSKIIISVIGIKLNREGEILAKKMVDLGKGKLYLAKELNDIEKLVIEDYYKIKALS